MKSKAQKKEESMSIVLGVDIGGTYTKFGYVDRKGKCLASASMPTNAHQPAAQFFSRLRKDSRRLFNNLPPHCELIGIGMGAPNANFYKSTIEHPPNLSWDYVDVRAEMEKHYSVPLAVTNDANACRPGRNALRRRSRHEKFYRDYPRNRARQRHHCQRRADLRSRRLRRRNRPHPRRSGGQDVRLRPARLPGSVLFGYGIMPNRPGADLRHNGIQLTSQCELCRFDRRNGFRSGAAGRSAGKTGL